MRVYVVGKGVTVPDGATALDAVRAVQPDDASDVESGSRIITDSRGLPIAADTPAFTGAIFRVVRAAAAHNVDDE